MKTWVRVDRTTICGCCHAFVRASEHMLEIRLPGVKERRYRCTGCAGAAPPDLPPVLELVPADCTREIVRPTVAAFRAQLPRFDYKQAAAGREPGEDDE